MITRYFNLYLNAGRAIPPVINVNQYDQGESWVFTLYNDQGIKYVPSSGSIIGIKSDKTIITNAATVNASGQVVVSETQQMTASAGKAVFELSIDGDTHGTANFVVLVEKSPIEDGVVSETDIPLIEQAIVSVGQLEDILGGQEVDEVVSPIISDWLDEHITNPSSPPIDTSLTVSGSAADAKATGDKIAEAVNAIRTVTSDDLYFTIGRLGESGVVIVDDQNPPVTRIISNATPVYCLGGTISCSSTYKFRVAYYSTPVMTYQFNTVETVTNFVKFSDWVTNGSYTVESGYYIVILAGYSSNANIANARDVSGNLNIALKATGDCLHDEIITEISSNEKGWGQGLYSASTGAYEASNYRIRQTGFIPSYVKEVFSDMPYKFRVCAYSNTGFVGILKTNNTISTGTSNMKVMSYLDVEWLRNSFPNYRFKLYAFSNSNASGKTIIPSEAKQIYYRINLLEKSLDDNAKFSGLNVAILGDSISTNGNSGIDSNVPELTVASADVGVQLSAYLTYYDVQAGLSLGGHTFTSSEIGNEVTFTPVSNDIGKSIGLPNNYNENTVTTWWEIMQEELGVVCIPNAWSGSSVTSHEANTDTRKCSYAWHPSQIRKCGIRTPGTMNRNEPDIIIIYRGTNDMTHTPYTLLTDGYFDSGTWDYPTTDVISGGYGYKEGLCLTIKKLRDAYPNAKIFLCTLNVFKRVNYSHFPTNNGINTLPQYNNAIREVANYMGCGIIEFDKDGITFENCYSQGYITDSSTIPTHPNDKGHRVMGLKAIADLKSQYSNMQ